MKNYTELQWETWLRNKLAVGNTNNIKTYGISVEDITFSEPFIHDGPTTLNFKNCVFSQKFTLMNHKPTAPVFFTNCNFEADFTMIQIISDHKIVFLDCIMSGESIIDNLTTPDLTLNLVSAQKIIFSETCRILQTHVGGVNKNLINYLYLPCEIIEKRLEINHALIQKLYIGSSRLNGELILANSEMNDISFETFRNSGIIKFLNCGPQKGLRDSKLLISQSNMGKTEFFRFDFAAYKKINITFSILLECLFISSKWRPKNMVSEPVYFSKELQTSEDKTSKSRAYNLREVLKQIKQASSAQGDKIQERYFHGLEMNEYNRTLSIFRRPWTKLILWLSWLTSNYGQSLGRPIFWLFLINVGILAGFKYVGITPYSNPDFLSNENLVSAIALFVRQSNPLHIEKVELTGWPFLIDMFGRICSSYLLYNIIRATRRFVQ